VFDVGIDESGCSHDSFFVSVVLLSRKLFLSDARVNKFLTGNARQKSGRRNPDFTSFQAIEASMVESFLDVHTSIRPYFYSIHLP